MSERGKTLVGKIIASGNVQENILIMREALRYDFSMRELQDMSLVDLCDLYECYKQQWCATH